MIPHQNQHPNQTQFKEIRKQDGHRKQFVVVDINTGARREGEKERAHGERESKEISRE
jgi:hypothetical protein